MCYVCRHGRPRLLFCSPRPCHSVRTLAMTCFDFFYTSFRVTLLFFFATHAHTSMNIYAHTETYTHTHTHTHTETDTHTHTHTHTHTCAHRYILASSSMHAVRIHKNMSMYRCTQLLMSPPHASFNTCRYRQGSGASDCRLRFAREGHACWGR